LTRTPEQHRADSRQAAHTMWSGVADRNERLRNAHDNGFASDNWHARRLFGADVDRDGLTTEQWEQVEAARKAWNKANSLKGVRARRLKRAQRPRAEADAIEAEADRIGETGARA